MDDPRYAGNPALFSTISREEDPPLDESEFSATVLQYIDQMLMEEDMEEEYSMFHDSLALQAAEKSFYKVIGEKYPSTSSSSSIQHHLHNYPNVESPEDSLSCSFSDYSTSCGSSYATTNTSSSAESHWSSVDPTDYNPSIMPTTFSFPSNFVFQSNPTSTTQSYINYHASDLTTTSSGLRQVVIKTEEVDDEGEHFLPESTGSNKQSAVYMDDSELSELFDKVLLGTGLGKGAHPNDEESNSSRGGKSSVRKHDNNEGVVDLRTPLILCAQAVSSDNRPLANEFLMQIKQHSSSTGDGTQRLVHCFANALEARMAGTGTHLYRALSSKRPSASDMVKGYQVYASACPFEKLAIIFANNSICNNVAKEVETLHIVDFGIRYGFKWPALIHRLSKRAGGPPKLRITGIEYPQPGLKLEDTGRCLARYCNRFNVPFEFNAIVAKKWETIKVEDLKIRQNEFVAVNCMFRFENLLDETVVLDNPRDAVLDLIRKANPSIFVHGIVNGNYDAAFFVTRFKEALFHYSALFDMLDTNVARDDRMRLMFEKFFGREVVNVVACEGCERVERPHTYKKWQLRNMRAGFRQLPLDHQIIEKLRGRLRDDAYHSDFMLHVDGNWVLQGWKGRILHASSCWVPA